jgi:outer membrane immunogenic protein
MIRGRIGLLIASLLAWVPARVAIAAPPPAAAPGWTGFYIGAAFGGGWSGRPVGLTANDPLMAKVFAGTVGGVNEQPFATSYQVDRNGPVGGLEVGYNFQVDARWVVGIETDFSASAIGGKAFSGTSILTGPIVTGSTTAKQDAAWYGTVRGRLGWLAAPNVMVFGTGGLAYGRTTQSATFDVNTAFFTAGGGFTFSCPGAGTCMSGSSATTQVGWTAGGGVEWALDAHWTAKAEYQLVDLGSETLRVVGNAPVAPGTAQASYNASFRDQVNVVRLGLNYRF